MQGVPAKHRALGRSVARRDLRRAPLLGLSPANSVVVAGSLANPLSNGGAGGASSSNSQPAPAPGSNGNGGGKGGKGGNSGNGSNGGNSGNGGNGGNGGNSGNGAGSVSTAPTPTTSPTSGGTVVSLQPVVKGPASPTSVSGNLSGSSNANNVSGGGSTADSSNPGGGQSLQGVPSEQSSSVDAGLGSSTTSGGPAVSTPDAVAVGFVSTSQLPQGSGSNTAVSPSSTITAAAAASSGKQLSGGEIAGIIIVCLFSVLALIFVIVRRRSIAGRLKLRKQWWSRRHSSIGSFDTIRSPVVLNREAATSRQSARSSFATNFDQGVMLRADSPSRLSWGTPPDFPPMAEVRERNSVLISTGGAIARKNSMYSMLGNGSEAAQYLTVSGQDILEPSTPMSVRPFSPSESFAFPRPPMPLSLTADPFSSGTHGPGSTRSSATLVHPSSPPHMLTTDLPPALVPTSTLYPQSSVSGVNFSAFFATDNPSIDPFADPEKPTFADIEVIRRPFKPLLDDELGVLSGDRVRLFQVFDDGWALVEKLANTEQDCYERGLIPVDCLREAGEPLPTFLTQKRVSNGSDQPVAVVL